MKSIIFSVNITYINIFIIFVPNYNKLSTMFYFANFNNDEKVHRPEV